MDLYSSDLNILEDLQIPNILEICYLYNLLRKYVKKYISIQASIFLFVSSVLKETNIIMVIFQNTFFTGLHKVNLTYS
jgi:hypothetical protein